ncbi:MAG: DNA gyrase subunit A [Patescibacteria group bacterium]
MAKDKETTNNEPGNDITERVISKEISSEMKESYLNYAMSVITARALPDVRDGLKPVHRRILYTMHRMGLSASAKTTKSAKVVGDVLGKYHPHGDTAVYDAMVKMAQNFTLRYPLVIGQGNFGSIDGDNAAAMRYTEAKMSKISSELLRDLDKETVEWRGNYDNTLKEPVVLPSATPNLLLNGTLGIAVGMATNIPPHNLREVMDAVIYLVDHEDGTTEDLLQFIKGPDFPIGGIIFGGKEMHHTYANGRGGLVVRGEVEIVEQKAGQSQIIITSIPYRVNKADLIQKIADLHKEKKLEEIKDLRDESTKDLRIVIDLKNGAYPQKVLNYLYKHTQLEDAFHFNNVVLVDGIPQTLSLKGILEEFIKHRVIVIRRRTEFDLRKAEEREHILLGLKKALDNIDKIIKTIKASKDTPTAHSALRSEFKFSDKQATAILEMKLQRLAGLERKKIEDELKEVQALIKELQSILSSEKRIFSIIKEESKEIANKYGDDRRSKVLKKGAESISVEDTIPDDDSLLVLTSGGYIKRTKPEEYKKQKRGGVGVVDLDTKEEDFVTTFLRATNLSDLLFFSDKGKAYQLKMYEIPEGKRATRGKSIMNFISLSADEKITSILAVPKNSKENKTLSLAMVTKDGVVKKVEAGSFHDVRRSGIIAIKLSAGDELVSAFFVDKGDEIMLVSARGQAIRFKEGNVRAMGRTAGGVRAMKMPKSDAIVGASAVSGTDKDREILVVSENGFGKTTHIKEYKVQGRGGTGIKTAKVTPKTGKLISCYVLKEGYDELVAISKKSKVIRLGLKEIPSLGRQTQGVRIMKLKDGDAIASMICI